MTTIVVMPGGFHPYHAGHHALYQSAKRTFPDAEVYVAATNDTSSRPFPFAVKEKLAKLAGVEAGHFVQVSSPFRAAEITSKYNPEQDVLIFVRSEKDAKSQPLPGGVKKDGSASYLQPLLGAKKLEPFAKHAYMAYLPTVEFGPGMTSATQIRSAWPGLDERRKTALVMSLYPKTQTSPKLAATVVKLLDAAIGGQEGVAEGSEEAEKYKAHLLKTAPRIMDFLAKTVKGWRPSEQEMLGAIDTAYTIMKHTGDVKQAGKAMMDELNTLHRMSQGQQGVAEGAPIVVAQAPIHIRNPKKAPQPYRNQGDIVPPTKPPSSEKRGVKGRPGQRPMPKYDEGMAEADNKCPPATQDIALNLNNRQKAIDEYGYGPLNPDLPNNKFWMKKVNEWNLDSMEEAQSSLCGNCAAFDIRQETLDCIAQGIDSDSPEDAEGVIDAGDLGYCKFLKFKCASRRTCDAWVTGGPLADKPVDENQGWAATYEEADPDYIEEKWSAKYKSSINCANPRGFSQKAHCAGRKK